METPELPELLALDIERARREPARQFVLAGAQPTPSERAAIARFHAGNPLGLAIVVAVIDPPKQF